MAKRKFQKNKKTPWVLVPEAPSGWGSHDLIRRELISHWESLGCRIVPLLFPNPYVSTAFLKTLRQEASTLVFSIGLAQMQSLKFLRRLRKQERIGVPSAIQIAGDFTRDFSSILDFRDSLGSHDRFVCNSSRDLRLTQSAWRRGPGAASIPLSVGPSLPILSDSERQNLKQQLGFPGSTRLLVYAGRISVQKNLHGLLRAFSQLEPARRRLHLAILGAPDEFGTPHIRGCFRPRYLPFLYELLTELRLEKNVSFLGQMNQESVFRYYQASDLSVSFTLHFGEDFGHAIAQGLSLGTPTCVTDWGGGADFIQSQLAVGVPVSPTKNGPRISPTDAREALLQALQQSSDATARRARADKFARNFGSDPIRQKWWTLFSQVPKVETIGDVEISPLFRAAYLRHKWLLSQDQGFAAYRFEVPRDPLYIRVQELYAGRRVASLKKLLCKSHELDSWFNTRTGEQTDPLCPLKKISAKTPTIKPQKFRAMAELSHLSHEDQEKLNGLGAIVPRAFTK